MRAHLEAMFRAAVDACHPARVLPPHLPDAPAGRTICLALGKAAAAMTRVVEKRWDGPLGGLALAPHGTQGAPGRIAFATAGHPLPDEAGVAAARRMLALAAEAGADDLVLVLLSGGASALACAPGEGLELDEKRRLTEALLCCGAPVEELNCVRRHLSRIKGGRLAAAAEPARVVTLAISDVVGDDPAAIGSGPTVADLTTIADARAILARHGIAAPARGWSESAKAVTGEYRIVARNADALEAAAAEARRLGYAPLILGEATGEARDVARAHAARALDSASNTALISGGELTVTVTGTGRGGPNQEYALALAGCGGIYGLAADTDGIDGLGHAAGGFFGGLNDAGGDVALAANDSAAWLAARDALFITGPTGTNVNDLRIILRHR
jgi:glycerate 2-kinase